MKMRDHFRSYYILHASMNQMIFRDVKVSSKNVEENTNASESTRK